MASTHSDGAAPAEAKQSKKICEIVHRPDTQGAEWLYHIKRRSSVPPRVYLQEGARPGGSTPAAGLFGAGRVLFQNRVGHQGSA